MTLRGDILSTKNKDFLNLKIENNSKIVIDYCNKKINIPNSILLLMEAIWIVYCFFILLLYA